MCVPFIMMWGDAASHVGYGIAGWHRHEVEVRGRLDTMTVLVSDAVPA